MHYLRFLLACLFLGLVFGCGSGLGNNRPRRDVSVDSVSGNLSTGLFFGSKLSQPITAHAAAGGVIPGTNSLDTRQVIFYAFVTEAAANGGNLDRDRIADDNGVADVFVAAVVDHKIDTTAFSYSLAGKFRHARCTACHSLVEPDTTVFAVTPHPGLPPGNPGLQNVRESTTNLCQRCHRFALDALEDQGSPLNFAWRNPVRSLNSDFRKLSTEELAARALSASENHFQNDRRVTWALASGIFTQISTASQNDPFGPNATGIVTGPADDDQDGVDEAFDKDGRNRLVPGGRANFITEVESFRSNRTVDTRKAITDVALVSRRVSVAAAGNGVSDQPAVAYLPKNDYVAGSFGSAGTLFVVFVSKANDIVDGVTGTFQQVYRASFDVRISADSHVDLVHTTTELISRTGTNTGGNNDSSAPAVSSDGNRIAFASQATDLVAGGAAVQHVYVREQSSSQTIRVSAAGTTDSSAPAMESGGTAIAFASLHDFDGGSPSGQTDIYYAPLGSPTLSVGTIRRASTPNTSGGSDTTGASRHATIAKSTGGEIFVAFASVNDLDTATFGNPTPAENIYVHRDNSGTRTTQLVSTALDITGVQRLPDGASRAPRFVGGPERLLIETDATNLDSAFLMPPQPEFGITTYKSGDENSAADIVMLDLSGFVSGSSPIRAKAISVSPAGAFGDRESKTPIAGGFAAPTGAPTTRFVGFAGLLTLARNLGAEDNHDGLNAANATPWLSFIKE